MAINKPAVLEAGFPEDTALIGAFLLCDYVGLLTRISFPSFSL